MTAHFTVGMTETHALLSAPTHAPTATKKSGQNADTHVELRFDATSILKVG